MSKAERGYAIRQGILRYLKRHKKAGLKALSIYLKEPWPVVRSHLAVMLSRGEVGLADSLYVPLATRTAPPVPKALPKQVNSSNKKAIPNQGGQGSTAPRTSVGRGIFGL